MCRNFIVILKENLTGAASEIREAPREAAVAFDLCFTVRETLEGSGISRFQAFSYS